jgi:hypothetical protein
MLLVSGTTTYFNRRMACPTDPAQAKSCQRVRRWSASIFCVSAMLYSIGFYFAFVASHIGN